MVHGNPTKKDDEAVAEAKRCPVDDHLRSPCSIGLHGASRRPVLPPVPTFILILTSLPSRSALTATSGSTRKCATANRRGATANGC